jgi:alkylation response protein AidB-like acyl-CoA dehydrogenase
MAEFKIDMRDVRFCLYEHLGLTDVAKLPRYQEQEQGREIYDMILDEAYKLSREKLGPISETGDKDGCRYEAGQVKMPAGYKEVYDFFSQNMWIAPTGDAQYGGQGLPEMLGACVAEMFTGANTAFMITQGLTVGAANLIHDFGNEFQKQFYLEKMYSGVWAGTMCLTEEGAGSDVGASRTKAFHVEDDVYRIEGTKVFISSGDQDLTENIVHLVLARTEGAPKGVKGLSLFIVPKYLVNPDGTRGEYNNVFCPKIEEKMGIHGSPTCVLDFGANDQTCIGYLLGKEFQGIEIMFHMMNEARLYVGIQGESLANAAYQHALDYAKERLQFQHFTQMGDPDAPKVAIVEHPDVRRMLMYCRSYAEAMRALIYWTAQLADFAKHAETKGVRDASFMLTELLTPICKAWCSDMGFRVTETALQVYGGYGYISEYPAEQILRDCKIASLYEGTNGIQALDLLGRKVAGKGGLRFMQLLQVMNEWIGKHKDHALLGDLVKAVDDAKNKLAEVTFGFQAMGKKAPSLLLAGAVPYLYMFGDVLGGYLLAQQAVIADEKLKGMASAAAAGDDPAALRKLAGENPEVQFYFNKIQTAKFYISRILPNIESYTKAIKTKDASLMDVVF